MRRTEGVLDLRERVEGRLQWVNWCRLGAREDEVEERCGDGLVQRRADDDGDVQRVAFRRGREGEGWFGWVLKKDTRIGGIEIQCLVLAE